MWIICRKIHVYFWEEKEKAKGVRLHLLLKIWTNIKDLSFEISARYKSKRDWTDVLWSCVCVCA